ncbi:unannotated protein [freshwater metagenome]|uniref:Unannotated protein n=1 Tax=freshwater metagenome TaxID=449393 RepID=A0A6J6YC30_9ZZZZ
MPLGYNASAFETSVTGVVSGVDAGAPVSAVAVVPSVAGAVDSVVLALEPHATRIRLNAATAARRRTVDVGAVAEFFCPFI